MSYDPDKMLDECREKLGDLVAGFGVSGSGCRVSGSGFRFRFSGLGFGEVGFGGLRRLGGPSWVRSAISLPTHLRTHRLGPSPCFADLSLRNNS